MIAQRFLVAALGMAAVSLASASEPARSSSPRVAVLGEGTLPGHFLQWRGKPILPIGDSVTQGWMECGANFDQHAWLDALARRGISALLIWSYIATSADAQREDDRIGYDSPEIWPWTGSPEGCDFDLTRLNDRYFARLSELVSCAEQRGILVVITVQDGWTKAKFACHPFNAALGNGPLSAGEQFVELSDYDREMPAAFDAGWDWRRRNQYFQERFAERLCKELESRTNVVFELFNEGEWYDAEQRRRHEEHFLRFFRRRTAAPLATNVDHIRSPSYSPRQNPAVDILALHKQPWTGHYEAFVSAFRTEPVRMIFETEPVPAFTGCAPLSPEEATVTLEIVRRTVWERALAGAGFLAQNDTSFGWDRKSRMAQAASLREEVYDILGHAARFFNGSEVRFWELAPHPELCSTGICSARPGVEYVAYSPGAGSLRLKLSVAESTPIQIRWYDPASGQFHPGSMSRAGTAVHQFAAPFAGDAVLHVRVGGPQKRPLSSTEQNAPGSG